MFVGFRPWREAVARNQDTTTPRQKAVPALTSFLLIVKGFPACAVAGGQIARPRGAGTRRRKRCEKQDCETAFWGKPRVGRSKTPPYTVRPPPPPARPKAGFP